MPRLALPTILLLLSLSACGEPVPNGNAGADDNLSNGSDSVTAEAVPVRIGELGPSFNACNAAGTTRHLEAGETLPVRSSPFDNGDQTGAIPASTQFFVCSRSIDQKWFGVVFSPDGRLANRCGVAEPVNTRRGYAGPCPSGWIASAYVKLIAGDDQPFPAANQAVAAPPAAAVVPARRAKN